MEQTTWACHCGTVTLIIEPGDGSRAICYCDDCQAFASAIGATDRLDAAGGTDLYQTTPDKLTVVSGADQITALRLSSKGPLRWYTACCKTPLANTGSTRQFPFSSMVLSGVTNPDSLGPVQAHVNRKFAKSHVEAKGSLGKLIRGLIFRSLVARLSGRWKSTPFFDENGTPVGAVWQLNAEERRQHTPPAG